MKAFPESVLLVEDDEDNADLIALTLERAGARVRTASSVAMALGLAEEPFDLLISDVHLPDGDAIDLLRGWPTTHERPAAMALTGDSDGETKRRLKAAGFDLVLQKPLSPEDLVARVTDVMRTPK